MFACRLFASRRDNTSPALRAFIEIATGLP